MDRVEVLKASAKLTCKEGVTEPTTELEFSERKTTEEVPYLQLALLEWESNMFSRGILQSNNLTYHIFIAMCPGL